MQVRRIENEVSRQVTFSKRRPGLLKKAHEIAVLCDVDVAAIVFSAKGNLFHYASSHTTYLYYYTLSTLSLSHLLITITTPAAFSIQYTYKNKSSRYIYILQLNMMDYFRNI